MHDSKCPISIAAQWNGTFDMSETPPLNLIRTSFFADRPAITVSILSQASKSLFDVEAKVALIPVKSG